MLFYLNHRCWYLGASASGQPHSWSEDGYLLLLSRGDEILSTLDESQLPMWRRIGNLGIRPM